MKKIIHLILFLGIVVFTVACSTNTGTIQDVFPISNDCQEDADCQLVSPEIKCSDYKCGSCGTEMIDNSNYVSVNIENYSQSSYIQEQCDFDFSKMRNCPACITTYEYTENIEAKCVNSLCTVVGK